MKSISISLVGLIILLVISFFIGRSSGLGNQKEVFGDSGFPKNCRALIAANIDGYAYGLYTADEALGSIDRNCGRFGSIWNER